MAKVTVYNKEGKNAGELELNEAVFAVKTRKNLVHQAYVAIEANAREPWAHAKDRSEVRGGGKKPWKQKGTGRARHGSSRSPIWKGGGVTFGPLNTRNFKKKVNRKSNREAVKMCLSSKITDEKFIVLEDLIVSGKTKEVVNLRNVLPGTGKSTLILTSSNDSSLLLATRNIPRVNVQRAQDVNVADLLHHQFIITSSEVVKVLEDRLA